MCTSQREKVTKAQVALAKSKFTPKYAVVPSLHSSKILSAYLSLPFLTPLVLRNSHHYKLGSQIWFGMI